MKQILFLLFVFPLVAFSQNTILWKVEKKENTHVSYLLGTFHLVGNFFIDEKPIVKEFLSNSEIAVFERVEDSKIFVEDVMNERNEDFSYRNNLSKEDVDFLEQYTATWRVPLCKHKPAELEIMLQQHYATDYCGIIKPTDTIYNMDDYLQILAESYHVPVVGLETASLQFDAINTAKGEELTWKQLQNAIHFWVDNLQNHTNQKEICVVAQEYLQLRFNYQFKVKCNEDNEILVKRNEQWIPKIMKYVDSQNAFITVGLLHLYGECGIISQLRKSGYRVTPVKVKQ